MEVYDSLGNRVFQHFWDGQSFTASQTRTFTAAWSVPGTASPGTYSVKLGIFSTGWGKLYNWNNQAATFTVN